VTEGEIAPAAEPGGGDGPAAGASGLDTGWVLGARWKAARHAGIEVAQSETGVDETLARCWMIVWAVAAGWGQWDLVDELSTLFG